LVYAARELTFVPRGTPACWLQREYKGVAGTEEAPTTSPLVSVVIAAHNAERFIALTLESLLAQTFTDYEAIIVDDGSSDRTADIVRDFAARDRRIRLHQQKQGGATAARNRGIAMARGSLLALLDADDIWSSTKLADQVEVMAASGPEVGLVYTWYRTIDEGGGPLLEITSTHNGDVLAVVTLVSFTGNGSTPMMRTEVVRRLGGFDPDLNDHCEDWELFIRIAEQFEFRCVPKVCVGYRQLAGGLSANHRAMESSFHILRQKLKGRRPDVPPSLLRASASMFFLYQGNRSAGLGHYGAGLRYLLIALAEDPRRVISRHFYVEVGKWLIRVLSLPFTHVAWGDQRRWGQLKARIRRKLSEDAGPGEWHEAGAPVAAVRFDRYDATIERRLKQWRRSFPMRPQGIQHSQAEAKAGIAGS
jgi:glycosyltransferase involved in cell wall biosynthesis